MTVNQDVLNWSVGALGAIGTIYATYMTRKSKARIRNEDEAVFVENADKFTSIWERISAPMQEEMKGMREEQREMLNKYTELKIEFEVSKSKSDFMIEQLKLRAEKAEVERDKYKKENEELRDQIGGGFIKKFG